MNLFIRLLGLLLCGLLCESVKTLGKDQKKVYLRGGVTPKNIAMLLATFLATVPSGSFALAAEIKKTV